MPVLLVPIHEFNPCHEPAGQSTGGRFCSTGARARDAFVPIPRASPMERLLAPHTAMRSAIREVRSKLVGRMARDGNEHLALVADLGPRGFGITYHTSGSDRFVEVADFPPDPVVLTAHTHPTGSAPSDADLRIQAKRQIPTQIIFGDGGEWYELTITDFARAQAVVQKGRRKATYWEKGTKGAFAASFDVLKKGVSREAAALTDQWIVKATGWTPATQGDQDGFQTPTGWVSRKGLAQTGAGPLKGAAIVAYHKARFAELSPRIWLTLAEKHKDWLQFRYHRKTGPYATP